jgi:hypothetical protein
MLSSCRAGRQKALARGRPGSRFSLRGFCRSRVKEVVPIGQVDTESGLVVHRPPRIAAPATAAAMTWAVKYQEAA